VKKLRQEFLNPPLPLRGAPFWSWNDELKVEELVRQLRDMKAHGMGGFFMHSREGLETEYMGPEWLECVRETVRAAAEEGMGAWLYDEDRWPSGAAGGLVPARGGDAFRAKVITIEECDTLPKEKEDVLAIFKAVIKDSAIVSAQRLPLDSTARLETGETFLILRRKVSGPSEWFNDDAYSDNLNPDAVAAFLDITYEAYRKEVGDEFGKAIPGIFTDEPNITTSRWHADLLSLPWTDGLVAYFQEHRGYDLLDVMPWVFYEGKGASKARHDYWRTVGQRYVEAYSQQLGEWCEKYGLAFTGHYLYENELGRAILANGAIMPHYRYQHVPGIDMLTEQTHEYLTIKQCTSVAHQFNRQRVLSETYGCSSWEFTFEGQKWVGDWQYVLGVNLRCQHLALYTLRGCRKRDYPPAFNYNTTWWKYNGVVEDYFARVGRVLTEGQPVRDVLLLHPVATGWSMLGANEASACQVDAYGEDLNTFARALLATHYDFDFGDEQIMATDGAVQDKALWVGQAPYKVVVIPPDTRTLLSTTVDLLEVFLDAGGSVIAVEPLPTMIETEPSERLAALLAHARVTVVPDKAGLQAALEAAVPRRVSLRNMQGQEAASLLYMQRAFEDKFAYFVVNTDRHNGYDVDLALEGSGQLEEWNPITGETYGLPARKEQGKLCFSANLGPAGSRIYVIDPSADAVAGETGLEPMDLRVSRRVADASLVGPVCPFSRTDPNLLTLDMCQYQMGDGEWSKTMEVWRAQSQIREALDMRQVYYNGLPQRYKWAMKPHPKDGAPVASRFTFRVRDIPSKPVYLLIEDAALFDISLNGQSTSSDPVGWYLDRGFHKVALPTLQAGINTIEISCAYTNHMELEDCFLLGDFGVSIDRVIIDEPQTLHFGDWTTQGYPHYAGSMIYHGQMLYEPQDGKRVRVYLGDYEAVDVAVHVNGTLAGHIPWISENGLDITAHLGPGLNNVDIEVVGSPRNMLGPLHLATGREPWTDSRSFRRTDETYTPDYVLKSWGLIGQVRLQQE
jgi:hypothetical protein